MSSPIRLKVALREIEDIRRTLAASGLSQSGADAAALSRAPDNTSAGDLHERLMRAAHWHAMAAVDRLLPGHAYPVGGRVREAKVHALFADAYRHAAVWLTLA